MATDVNIRSIFDSVYEPLDDHLLEDDWEREEIEGRPASGHAAMVAMLHSYADGNGGEY